MEMHRLDECLWIREAIEYLGVCRSTLRNWEVGGRIPVYRNPANNYRLFKRADLEKIRRKLERPVNKPSKVAGRKRTV